MKPQLLHRYCIPVIPPIQIPTGPFLQFAQNFSEGFGCGFDRGFGCFFGLESLLEVLTLLLLTFSKDIKKFIRSLFIVKPQKNLDMNCGFIYSSQGDNIQNVSLENYNLRIIN